MEFKVTRTSMYEGKPCKEAVKKRYTRVETRMFKNFEEFDRRFSNLEGKWLSKGVNHCVKRGYIQREFPNECEGWFINIDTLEELLAFQKKYGNIILTTDWRNPNVLELEIYDDYRE